jgi:hypothetical protein
MPLLVDPMPPGPAARLGAPDDAQEASYFAASERMARRAANLESKTASWKSGCSLYVLTGHERNRSSVESKKAAQMRRFPKAPEKLR